MWPISGKEEFGIIIRFGFGRVARDLQIIIKGSSGGANSHRKLYLESD